MTKTATTKRVKKTAQLTPGDVAGLLTCAAVPGWSMFSGIGYVDCDGELWTKDGYGEQAAPITTSYATFLRTVDDLRVAVHLNVVPCSTGKFSAAFDSARAFTGVLIEGHTRYNCRTFTRRGLDVSSCSLRDTPEYDHEYANLPELLAGEWARCEAAHARAKTMVIVPGLPGDWRVTPERRASISASLQASKRATFTPHGMGTGYEISRGCGDRFATKLPAETSAFFGVLWALYYTTLDCD